MSVGVSIKQLEPTHGGIYRALMLRGAVNTATAFTSTFEGRPQTDQMVVKTPRRSDHGNAGRIRRRRCLIGTVRLERPFSGSAAPQGGADGDMP